jgi:thiamine pyrophosphokinase
MRAIIIANGNEFSSEFFERIREKSDYIICADGGYKHLKRIGIEPDEVLGDFDSMDKDSVLCDNVAVYPSKKDDTDTEIAIRRALELGATDIVLLGCIGSRMDHTLANLFLLKEIYRNGANGMLVDEHNFVYYMKDKLTVKAHRGDLLSILPMTPVCEGVTTAGLYYVLCDDTLKMASSRGVSNVLTEDTATITIRLGEALVILATD